MQFVWYHVGVGHHSHRTINESSSVFWHGQRSVSGVDSSSSDPASESQGRLISLFGCNGGALGQFSSFDFTLEDALYSSILGVALLTRLGEVVAVVWMLSS